MISQIVKQFPSTIKHPWSTFERWQWRARGLPAQSSVDIQIFKRLLLGQSTSPIKIFEWGMGSSTLYYCRFLNKVNRDFEWYAVDNSRIWHGKVLEKTKRYKLVDKVRLHCKEFPAFWQLPGYTIADPKPSSDESNKQDVLDYIDLPNGLGGGFQLIFIDGRYRRRCLLTAKEALSPKGVVVLHDAHRVHYHESLGVFTHVYFIETGNITGRPQKSSIAICSMEAIPIVDELVARYG